MFYLFKYFIKRLPREGFKSLSVTALALALVFLINALAGIREQMLSEYEYVMDNYEIFLEVSNGDGTAIDGLAINESYLDQFTDPDAFWSLAEYVTDIQLKRELDILDTDKESAAAWLSALYLHTDVSYLASDYNAGVEWNRDPDHIPWTPVEAYPDPEIYIERLEAYGGGEARMTFHEGETIEDIMYDLLAFYPYFEIEEGEVEYKEGDTALLVTEDLLDYIDAEGKLSFDIIEHRGQLVRVYSYQFEVCGVIRGPVNGSLVYSWFEQMNPIWQALGYWPGRYGGYGYVKVYAVPTPLPDGSDLYTWNLTLEINVLPITEVIGSLTGLTFPEAYSGLSVEKGVVINYYEGYDAEIFMTGANVAIVSEDVLAWADGGMLRVPVSARENAINETIAELEIIGTVSGVGQGMVFTPFATASRLGVESDGRPQVTEILRARIADNNDLVAFKRDAMRTFSEVGVFFNEQVFSMTIFDAEFYDLTEALQQTVFFIDLLTPFVYFITVCVGFIASFLLTRRRTSEFAVMRSVGVNKESIFLMTLLEQGLLCAGGVVLGCAVFYLTWDMLFISRPLVFLGCYLLGAILSAARAARTDVLRLLREKE